MTIDSDTTDAGHGVGPIEAGGGVAGCDGRGVYAALRAASAWLDAQVPQINALNVFPVPDGDTGTNMSLTMRAALDEAASREYTSVSELAQVVAHGALMGARGNSGVILSQVLRGLARSLDAKEVLTTHDLAAALTEGAATAYKGVMKPVEGTMLTVARETADAARQAAELGGDLRQVLESALTAARASVARTPSLLPVLAEAKVVDAGGQGLAVLLEGVLRYLRGEEVQAAAEAASAPVAHAEAPAGEYNYDTQFVIQGEALDVEAIRATIAELGDSVLVVGDERAVKVHVHTDYPGRALDYGIGLGRVTAVIVENMQEQYEQFVAAGGPQVEPAEEPETAFPEPPGDTAIVAVAAGEGLKRVFESLGACAVVEGGQTMNPSTHDLLSAVEAVPRDKVIILPNNRNIILAAQQARDLSSKQVAVVPTRTVPQGIAALLAYNFQSDLEANCEQMLESAQQVQTAEVTRAVRSVQLNGLEVAEGQVIGLINGDLVTVGTDVDAVVCDLLARMRVHEFEVVTVYYGAEVNADQAAALVEEVRIQHPGVEIEVLSGGQAHYHYIISAE